MPLSGKESVIESGAVTTHISRNRVVLKTESAFRRVDDITNYEIHVKIDWKNGGEGKSPLKEPNDDEKFESPDLKTMFYLNKHAIFLLLCDMYCE